MDRTALILKNSETLNALHQRIHETVKLRDKSPEGFRRWSIACDEFHRSFDELVFPGGGKNFLKVRGGDILAIEAAIDFLLADPVHFRSGYIKEDLWCRAPKWPLSTTMKANLEKAAFSYLVKRMRRDFWYMCRAMARIATPSFWQQVRLLSYSDDPLVAKRASYLFAYSLGVEAGERIHTQVGFEARDKKYGRR